jgi:hypothetical protein
VAIPRAVSNIFQAWWLDRLPVDTLLYGYPLNFLQRLLDIAAVCVMATEHLADS